MGNGEGGKEEGVMGRGKREGERGKRMERRQEEGKKR